MSRISASAPGKIVVCGEYAVLDGATAISMAVNRRARVTLEPGRSTCHEAQATGIVNGAYRFTAGDSGAIEWRSPCSLPLLESIWGALQPGTLPPLSFKVDTSAFGDPESGAKYGFGSSAAVAVALSAALCAQCGMADNAASVAEAAHRHFQDGKGSGVDVATSRCGGLIGYRMHSDSRPLALRWPSSLQYRVFWSGRVADTAGKLARLTGTPGDKSSASLLVRKADQVAEQWQNNEAGTLLRALREYVEALNRFDEDHNLDIFAAGHGRLLDLAHDFDVIYKPCGAGGGDIGIVMSDAEDGRMEKFEREATQRGFVALDVSLDTDGVSVVEEAA